MTHQNKPELQKCQAHALQKIVAELELQRDLLLRVSCDLKDYQSERDLEREGHASAQARAAIAKASQSTEPPHGS